MQTASARLLEQYQLHVTFTDLWFDPCSCALNFLKWYLVQP